MPCSGTPLGGAGHLTSNHAFTSQPALPPELLLPSVSVYVCIVFVTDTTQRVKLVLNNTSTKRHGCCNVIHFIDPFLQKALILTRECRAREQRDICTDKQLNSFENVRTRTRIFPFIMLNENHGRLAYRLLNIHTICHLREQHKCFSLTNSLEVLAGTDAIYDV